MIQFYFGMTDENVLSGEATGETNLFYQTGEGSDSEYSISSIKLTTEINQPGLLEFFAPYNSYFSKKISQTEKDNYGYYRYLIYIFKDSEFIWKGRIMDTEIDLYGNRHVTCEEETCILKYCQVKLRNIQTKMNENDGKISIYDFFSLLINDSEIKNNFWSNMDIVPKVSKTISSEMISPKLENVETSSIYYGINYLGDCITKYLLDEYGGYIKFYKEIYTDESNNKKVRQIIEYLSSEDLIRNESQVLDSKNIINLTKKIITSEGYTNILGIGKIKTTSNNDGYYLYSWPYGNDKSYTSYATFCLIKEFDTIFETTDDFRDYLKSYYDDVMIRPPIIELEINAVDLSLIDKNVKPIKAGELIRVISPNQDIDDYFLCSKVVLDISNPENSEYYVGGSTRKITNSKEDYIKKYDYVTTFSHDSLNKFNERLKKLGG